MIIIERDDLPHAYVVHSGEETYNIYLGPDLSLPQCDCPGWTWRETCRHVDAVKRLEVR